MIRPDPRFDWLADIGLATGPPDLRMGTRALDTAQWLRPDSFTADELVLRSDLLQEHTGLIQVGPNARDAVEELYEFVETHLDRELGAGRDPFEQLSTLACSVPDDFLIMGRHDDFWRLIGGCLVFPNHWTIAEKMNLTLAEIHVGVDGYQELLAEKMDRFFDRINVDRPVWRRNWFLHDDPSLFKPGRQTRRMCGGPSEAATLWVRSEWQVVRRLPKTDTIVFTVKSQVAPLREIKLRPDAAIGMQDFLRAASERSLLNKDAVGRDRAVIGYLSNDYQSH